MFKTNSTEVMYPLDVCGMQAYMSSTEKDDSQVVYLRSTNALMVKDIFKTATSKDVLSESRSHSAMFEEPVHVSFSIVDPDIYLMWL